MQENGPAWGGDVYFYLSVGEPEGFWFESQLWSRKIGKWAGAGMFSERC